MTVGNSRAYYKHAKNYSKYFPEMWDQEDTTLIKLSRKSLPFRRLRNRRCDVRIRLLTDLDPQKLPDLCLQKQMQFDGLQL